VKEGVFMKILQSVVVKQVITEKSKKELLANYEATLFQLRKECEQLQFEQKKLEKTNKENSTSIKSHFRNEIENRQDKIKNVTFQLEQLLLLPIGSEIKEKEVQGIVDIQVGDDWSAKWRKTEIIIKDGIVTEIR
jgi:hypothetical protein